MGSASEVADRLGELATIVEGPLAPARATHAFESIGAQLLAAEAAVDAAVEWAKAGRRARARRRSSGPRPSPPAVNGASTPALRSVASRVQLTKSEREVAVRAAAGRSNKEIAEALFLSRGTVQNYLHRAYEKLGITSRAELSKAWSNAREPRPSQSAAPVRRSPAAPRITT